MIENDEKNFQASSYMHDCMLAAIIAKKGKCIALLIRKEKKN